MGTKALPGLTGAIDASGVSNDTSDTHLSKMFDESDGTLVGSHGHSHSHSHARSSRNSIDGDRPCAYTPHEAVFRSRLEGVLRGAQAYERRECLEMGGGSGSGGSSNSNSFASSRNMSGEGETFFAAGEVSLHRVRGFW